MTEGSGGGGEPTDLTLEDVLTAAAEGLGDVVADASTDGTAWTRFGTPFAWLSGTHAEFRLDPLVARAALRTPETRASARGPDWVAFAPGIVDDGDVDRAEAWFLSAHRRAAAGRR
jgi:hypothetical protein